MFRSFRLFLCVVLPLIAGATVQLCAQDVTEVTLKGAFLFNFARFTEWPADAFQGDSPIAACVVGDDAVEEAFSRTIKGKHISGRPVTVRTLSATKPLPACQVLYLSGVADGRLAEIVAAVRDIPVLTVSDSEAFSRRGGIVELFVDAGKMKFRINARSAKRARLHLSSRLLALAEIVDEEPSVATAHVPGPSETAPIPNGVVPLTIESARRPTALARN
jgi:hypothetical protein